MEYATALPEINRVLEDRRLQTAAEVKAAEIGNEGERLVGFGQHDRMTRKALYESTEKEHKLFVQFILKKKDAEAWSKMHQFRAYCLRRHDQDSGQPPSLPAPSADSDSDVDDEVLLAAARLMESE